MTVINTNIAATITANAMRENSRTMENSMERLATGKRINSASDDAAGLAIGSRMEAQIRGLEQAARNSNDAIAYVQTFDGAATEIGDMLQRMRELSVQATNGTNGTDDIANLDKEFAALATEIDRIAADTKFNGIASMAAGMSKSFTIGADSDDLITVDVKSFALADGASAAGTGGVQGTATVAATTANLLLAIENSGSVQISDGSTMLNINLQDIQVANNLASITALNGQNQAGTNDFTMAEFIVAVDAKADASSTFTGGFSSSDETGFTVSEKAAFYGSDDTYTVTGSNSFSSVNGTANGTAGATGGIYGISFSDYKNTSSTAVTVSQTSTITALDTAIKNLSSARADFGAVINRLEHTVDNLNASAVNTKAARSGIIDADYASETTELARTQIIAQASTAMLSQANQQAQSVLALLK